MILSGCSVAEHRLGLMEQRLIEHFAGGGTAEEAADEFGVSAAEAYQRVKEALSRIDVWKEDELREMIIFILQKHLGQANAVKDAANPKSVEAVAKLVQAIDKLQSKQFTISDADIERAAVAHSQRMSEIVRNGYNKARAVLVLEYPQVPIATIDEAFRLGLIEAAREADGPNL